MKEFKCKDLGFNDGWFQAAMTDERLLESVSLHMREAHDMNEVSPAMLATIRNSFTATSTEGNLTAADLVLYQYNCEGEPECTWRYIEEVESLLGGRPASLCKEQYGVGAGKQPSESRTYEKQAA